MESKIVGGYHVSLGERPFIVSIRKDNEHICTGSLISNEHVLTTASCVVLYRNDGPFYEGYTVVAGTISRTGDDGIHRRIFAISINRYYKISDHALAHSDIAIIGVSS